MLITTTRLAQFISFIRLGRPQFLAGGFLLHGLGVAMALYSGTAWLSGVSFCS